jgi:hypothetical protein
LHVRAKPTHDVGSNPTGLLMKRHGQSSADASPPAYNIVPFASMAGGWLGPLLMFWLYVWGPLRPFAYPSGNLMPDPAFWLVMLGCVALWWLPPSYYRVRSFERSGRVYKMLGVRQFRRFVPDGDLANRWARRRDPSHRVIHGRRSAAAFLCQTEESERAHLVLLTLGVVSAGFALYIGWPGWAFYLSVGNVLVNLYPILLQRYTRARIVAVLDRAT